MKSSLSRSLQIGESIIIATANGLEIIKNKKQVLVRFKNVKVLKMSLEGVFDKKFYILKII